MKDSKTGVFTFFSSLIMIAAVILAIAFIYKYTNGFESDFTTFYVKVDDKRITSDTGGFVLEENKTKKIEVKYTFGKIDNEKKGYTVRVVPHVDMENNFFFVVDGVELAFSDIVDFTRVFDITLNDDYFTIAYNGDLDYILKTACNGNEISSTNDKAFTDMFAIEIYSYNKKEKISIFFTVNVYCTVEIDKTEIVF